MEAAFRERISRFDIPPRGLAEHARAYAKIKGESQVEDAVDQIVKIITTSSGDCGEDFENRPDIDKLRKLFSDVVLSTLQDDRQKSRWEREKIEDTMLKRTQGDNILLEKENRIMSAMLSELESNKVEQSTGAEKSSETEMITKAHGTADGQSWRNMANFTYWSHFLSPSRVDEYVFPKRGPELRKIVADFENGPNLILAQETNMWKDLVSNFERTQRQLAKAREEAVQQDWELDRLRTEVQQFRDSDIACYRKWVQDLESKSLSLWMWTDSLEERLEAKDLKLGVLEVMMPTPGAKTKTDVGNETKTEDDGKVEKERITNHKRRTHILHWRFMASVKVFNKCQEIIKKAKMETELHSLLNEIEETREWAAESLRQAWKRPARKAVRTLSDAIDVYDLCLHKVEFELVKSGFEPVRPARDQLPSVFKRHLDWVKPEDADFISPAEKAENKQIEASMASKSKLDQLEGSIQSFMSKKFRELDNKNGWEKELVLKELAAIKDLHAIDRAENQPAPAYPGLPDRLDQTYAAKSGTDAGAIARELRRLGGTCRNFEFWMPVTKLRIPQGLLFLGVLTTLMYLVVTWAIQYNLRAGWLSANAYSRALYHDVDARVSELTRALSWSNASAQ
ncbi:hypothetical protein JX266_013818 [Neoarthrinium moseri]|nr:hypothetical protein JX266_013818 [Neoarthrinium moseri]